MSTSGKNTPSGKAIRNNMSKKNPSDMSQEDWSAIRRDTELKSAATAIASAVESPSAPQATKQTARPTSEVTSAFW